MYKTTLILYGLPMSGKTTLGRKLAQILNKNFIDTDHLIQDAYFQQTGNKFSCRQIVQREGEPFFRKLESEIIRSLANTQDIIIALGGGTLMNSENVDHVKKMGRLVYLKAEPEILWERTKKCGIPAYLDSINPEKAFYKMAVERSAQYESIADIILDSLDDKIRDLFGK